MDPFVWTDAFSQDLLKQSGLNSTVNKVGEILEMQVIYTGEMAGALRHGRGTQFWPDGACFDGYFVKDKIEGFGRMIHSNGEVYIGYWQDN